jgi:hypothetical protein
MDMDLDVILDDCGDRRCAIYFDWALIGEPQFFAFGHKGPKDGLAEHPHRRDTGASLQIEKAFVHLK